MSEPSHQSPQISLQARGEMPVLFLKRWRRALLDIVRSGMPTEAVVSSLVRTHPSWQETNDEHVTLHAKIRTDLPFHFRIA
jgi:hypothetical protein